MPLKYESMPKITFCFTKDYLEEIKHFQFFQCFETRFTLYADVLFSNISAQDTVKQIKKKHTKQETPE